MTRDEEKIREKILEVIRSEEGVALYQVEQVTTDFPFTKVAKILYTMADSGEIVMERGDMGTHYFYEPPTRRRYKITVRQQSDSNPGVQTSYAKTDSLERVLEFVTAAVSAGAWRVEILNDPRDHAPLTNAQDLDKASDDCSCPPGMKDCKRWSCPRM